ncbi:hypothetical protein SISSUDRAFT_1065166 [Sistotremastrum suecicum HHB10207 ss-3]|uniref:Uncharacterized protein n=1 Tax=Sistotremastrum suecicum HHB10207 ss-3 TaxID=1314776 RepID=A0A165ZTA3_9AGAM|nr:hypothetical protein SISSUDRAFT_1065166 [Sistotremastrum suecicum HHB10207 ss-3]
MSLLPVSLCFISSEPSDLDNPPSACASTCNQVLKPDSGSLCQPDSPESCFCSDAYLTATSKCYQCIITQDGLASNDSGFQDIVDFFDTLIEGCQSVGFEVPTPTLTGADGVAGSTVPSSTGGSVAALSTTGSSTVSSTDVTSSSSTDLKTGTTVTSTSAAMSATTKSGAATLEVVSINLSIVAFLSLALLW